MPVFEPFNSIGPSRYGQMIYNRNDVYIGRSIELYGEYSEGETSLFEQLVEHGQLVVEAGANIGAHTRFLAQQVGPAGKVLAFEPQRVIFQTLCGNLAINSITNVHCRHMALGAETGQTVVPQLDYCQVNNFGGVGLEEFDEGEVVTIDSFHLPRCDFLKIDVEGMEEDVLRGAESTIGRFKPILYFKCDRTQKADSLIRYAHSLGYALYWHLPYLFNPQNFTDNHRNVFGEVVSKNILCVNKVLESQLSGFEKFDIPQAA